jgi:wyosine [tRNA(Phe)-imidazoG37] synthetase (radical SAM superfamily)
MLLEPKPGIIYGPVASRRLGHSLGINLLAPGQKNCTLDCAYCQYGWTRRAPAPGDALPTAAQVLDAVEAALVERAVTPAFLTFSGNGEPTSHPDFRAIVAGVRRLRDRWLPTAKLAVLSNSTLVDREETRQALDLLDVRIMKLDAGTEELFQRYARPTIPVTLAAVTAGLARLRDVTLQALFTGGAGGNAAPDHVAAWIDRVVALAPVTVQLYSLDRDWPARDVVPLSRRQLDDIAAGLRGAGCRATVYARD